MFDWAENSVNINDMFDWEDLIYVAYHDEEWGVPAHDDK